MRARRLLLPACLLACALLPQPPAEAYIMVGNGRLDRAFWKEYDAPIVVAGRIQSVRRRPQAELDVEGGPAEVGCALHVEHVLLGSGTLADDPLELDIAAFAWPRHLLPLEPGQACIVVLRAGALQRSNEPGRPRPLVIVPARAREYVRVGSREAALQVIESELLAALRAAGSAERQRALLLQLAPILHPQHAPRVAAFLASEDAWLRRAALGALLCATPAPGYVELARLDLRDFLAGHGPRDMVQGLEEGVSYAPYPLWVGQFPCLDTGWSPDDARPAFLPLWRELAATAEEGGVAWTWGLAPLCRIGTDADLRLLWEAWRARAASDGGSSKSPSWQRKVLLLGLARILGIVVGGAESEQAELPASPLADRVRAALEARGEPWLHAAPPR